MLALGELLVKPPEYLHNAQGGGAHGVREVATGRRDGADDGDGADALRRAHQSGLARAFVEGGEAGAEVGRVARIGGHLGQTARDLTQRLSPARGRVGHHGCVHTHVAHVLGHRDARINGGLASSDGHVRGVRNEGGALHDRLLLAVHLHRQLREVLEHLRHLVTTLAAADVNDAI